MFITEWHKVVVSVCADLVLTNIVDILVPYSMSLCIGCSIPVPGFGCSPCPPLDGRARLGGSLCSRMGGMDRCFFLLQKERLLSSIWEPLPSRQLSYYHIGKIQTRDRVIAAVQVILFCRVSFLLKQFREVHRQEGKNENIGSQFPMRKCDPPFLLISENQLFRVMYPSIIV